MSKIIVEGFKDPAIQAWAHSSHYLDLYLSFFKEVVESEKRKTSGEPIIDEFGTIYGDWATEEMYKLGLVTVYHHWEKCIKKLLNIQAKQLGLNLLKNNKRMSFVEHTKLNLEQIFSCYVEENIWEELNETRAIVNCYKHGTSDKFRSLYEAYPCYFEQLDGNNDLDYSDYFILGEINLKRLGENILNFWEFLPREYTWG